MSEVPPVNGPDAVPPASPPPPPPAYPPPPPAPMAPGGYAPAYQPGQRTPLPPGIVISTAGKRLGGYALDTLLAIVTLGIGWLVWSFVIWGSSQTPAKQILKMKTVDIETGQRATYGKMFLREFVGKWLIVGVLIGGLCFIAELVLDFMLLWDKDRQQLWDKVSNTIVVDDPNNVLV